MTAAPADINTVLPGGYELRRVIDQGSFATVYEAVNAHGEGVAVKLLTSTHPQAGRRFEREIKVMRSLPQSEHVVGYLDHGRTADGEPFIVMELIQGPTLAQMMEPRRRFSESAACALMMPICEAFAALHRLGLTHGDIKPANIMLAPREGGRRRRGSAPSRDVVHIAEVERATPKLIDFGLVRDAQGLLKLLEEEALLPGHEFQDQLDAGVVMGTPEYIAPEQVSDARNPDTTSWRTDTPADVFGLGVVFYELITGDTPWPFRCDAEGGEAYRRSVVDYLDSRAERLATPPRPESISPALWSVLARALHADPKRRQGDAKALYDDIQRYVLYGVGVPGDLDNEETVMAYLPDLDPRQSAQAREPAVEQAAEEGEGDDGDEGGEEMDLGPRMTDDVRDAPRWVWAATTAIAALVGSVVYLLLRT